MKILFIIILTVIALILLTAYVCYVLTFKARKEKPLGEGEYDFPDGKIYKPYYPMMKQWTDEVRAREYEEVSITSFDGLKLYGKYYECEKGAPIELMFHGYRGNAERDLCGGVNRCFALKRNILLVDQRTSGKSEGKVITFGINESRDCLDWIDFIIEHYGKDTKIILTGISMGASTVMIAAGNKLPENVLGVLADCGYTSAKEIIQKVIKQIHLPPKLLYPFIKLGAKLFGNFDLEKYSPIEAMKKCTVPVVFAHGDADDFVPCEMSVQNYEACVSQKRIIIIEGAGHGLAYPADTEKYLDELAKSWTELGIETKVEI